MRPRVFILTLVVALVALGCRPDLGDRESLVSRTAVLAVRGDPPEAKPGETVRYTLLVASPAGPIVTPVAAWAFCATPKLLTENGAVSAACLTSGVRPISDGASEVEAAMPLDACALFGPEVTSAELRPRDADVTGGYYQPVRAIVGGAEPAVAFGLERIRCGLANAPADVTTTFAKGYVANANPELAPLEAFVDGAPVAEGALPRGARIRLRASWPETSAEPYPVYDLARRGVVTRREALRVSWFATAGAFDVDRTGRGEEEPETFTENVWTAPGEARTTHVFAVLRDARGGVAFATLAVVTAL